MGSPQARGRSGCARATEARECRWRRWLRAAAASLSPGETQPPFDPASLPPIESTSPDPDIRAFLAAGVPADIARAALRRVWSSDPMIRDFVGLSENSWDFNAPGAMPGFGPIGKAEVARLVTRLLGEPDATAAAAHPPTTPTQADKPETHASEFRRRPEKSRLFRDRRGRCPRQINGATTNRASPCSAAGTWRRRSPQDGGTVWSGQCFAPMKVSDGDRGEPAVTHLVCENERETVKPLDAPRQAAGMRGVDCSRRRINQKFEPARGDRSPPCRQQANSDYSRRVGEKMVRNPARAGPNTSSSALAERTT